VSEPTGRPASEQERFWSGEFGDAYSARNTGADVVAGNLALFSRILSRTDNVASVLELGANIGLNLRALRQLIPDGELAGVEINPVAAQELRAWGGADVHEGSILDLAPGRTWDLTFCKGVLIHIAPADLPAAYQRLYDCSSRYVLVAEYYNPSPVTIPYRGHDDRLFKRDFAGDLLERYADLRLVDYGFVYHRDPVFPLDDITWFLLEKAG
jgi:pseudaminic acid biosynthesis-associated methylase